MKVLVVLAHPEHQSFNGAMFRTAVETLSQAGHEVKTSDLHAMAFDPVSGRHNFLAAKDPDYFKQQIEELHATETYGFAADIENEIQKLEWCDLMIWQCPLWWFGLPAILKGWADRTLAFGRAYDPDHRYATGVFRGKRAMLSMTTGGPAPSYVKGGPNGDIDSILRPIERGIFQFVGFDVLRPQLHWGPVRQDGDTRQRWLDAFAARLRAIEHEAPIEVGPY
jgi:NAD(P)H dehydrogenase (quinone)